MTWGTVPWAGIESGGDATPPSIGNFVPIEGVALGRTNFIQFDVTDNDGAFSHIGVFARFVASGVCETIYNGLGFESRYAAGSSRTGIANGARFTVRRQSGWLCTPVTFVIVAVDTFGNVARVEITR